MTCVIVDDHDAREARLADIGGLVGPPSLEALLGRFAGSLHQLLETEAPDGWSVADAHRLAGLGGLLGFVRMERALREVEDDPRPLTEATKRAVRDAAREAIAFIRERGGLDPLG